VSWRLCAGYLRVCRFLSYRSANPRTAATLTLHRGNWEWRHINKLRYHHVQTNIKSPEADNASLDAQKLKEATDRALDYYLNPQKALAPRKPCTMFIVAPDMDTESLLAHACESLASASILASDFAAHLQGPDQHTAMAIQQIVMLAELAVNRALDNADVATAV
jgi:hypothetical protein